MRFTDTDVSIDGEFIEYPEELEGNRNLIIGVNYSNSAMRSNNSAITPIIDEAFDEHRRVKRVFSEDITARTLSCYTVYSFNGRVGEEYTVSIEVKPEVNITLSLWNGDSKLCIADIWTTLTWTLTLASERQLVMGLLSGEIFSEDFTPWIEYRNMRAEKGSKATPHIPAPEDLGLFYPENITHFGTSFNKDNLIINEFIEYPEEFRGGRNLILNSQNILMMDSDGGNNSKIAKLKDGYVSIIPISTGNIYHNPLIPTSLKMEKNETYTLSFKISTHNTIGLYWHPSEKYVKGNFIPNTQGEWMDISFTYTQTDDTQNSPTLWGFHQLEIGKEIRYTPPKLEIGSISTSWTPAPEDLGLFYPENITHFGTYFKHDTSVSPQFIEKGKVI